MLNESGNVEADFTNYERKVILNTEITVEEDPAGKPVSVKVGDLVWSDAGGQLDEDLARLLF